jgi:hypothetical protein
MKEVTIVFFCTWKFAATFPVAVYAMNMSVFEILLYSNIGGIIGVFFFSYVWKFLIDLWITHQPETFKRYKKKKKIFTRRSRLFAKIRNRYGLPGIVILSPVILSIPVGVFLAVKYYGRKKSTMAWLIAGQIVWSVIYTFFYIRVKTVM